VTADRAGLRDAVVWRDKIAAAIAFAGDDLGPDSGVAEYRAAADAVLAVVGPLLDQAEADRDAAREEVERLSAYIARRQYGGPDVLDRALAAEAQVAAVEIVPTPAEVSAWIIERYGPHPDRQMMKLAEEVGEILRVRLHHDDYDDLAGQLPDLLAEMADLQLALWGLVGMIGYKSDWPRIIADRWAARVARADLASTPTDQEGASDG
jgi:hypothetical protein